MELTAETHNTVSRVYTFDYILWYITYYIDEMNSLNCITILNRMTQYNYNDANVYSTFFELVD